MQTGSSRSPLGISRQLGYYTAGWQCSCSERYSKIPETSAKQFLSLGHQMPQLCAVDSPYFSHRNTTQRTASQPRQDDCIGGTLQWLMTTPLTKTHFEFFSGSIRHCSCIRTGKLLFQREWQIGATLRVAPVFV